MALIKCEECDNDVSDKATICPFCGNPINEVFFEDPVTTIQKTYRVWKLIKLLSWALIIVGILLLPKGELAQWAGISGLGFGVLGLIMARLGAWWTNG